MAGATSAVFSAVDLGGADVFATLVRVRALAGAALRERFRCCTPSGWALAAASCRRCSAALNFAWTPYKCCSTSGSNRMLAATDGLAMNSLVKSFGFTHSLVPSLCITRMENFEMGQEDRKNCVTGFDILDKQFGTSFHTEHRCLLTKL